MTLPISSSPSLLAMSSTRATAGPPLDIQASRFFQPTPWRRRWVPAWPGRALRTPASIATKLSLVHQTRRNQLAGCPPPPASIAGYSCSRPAYGRSRPFERIPDLVILGPPSDRGIGLLSADTGGIMATFQNTVTIRRAIEDVFAFLADFENVPTWNYAIVETKKTSPGTGGRRDHLPTDPFRPRQKRRGLQSDRLRADQPPGGPRRHRALHRHHRLPAHAYRRRDTPDQCRGPQAILRCVAAPGSPGRLQGQGVGGSQPRHPQAGTRNGIAIRHPMRGNPSTRRSTAAAALGSLLTYDACRYRPRTNYLRGYGR